ncbi:MAG: hypothetical protein C4576_28750 [Desulfobacteraceae bacterium]|nr:MAG: hypothetical protein C4576_28750 [Desulfobacteraceae bacterium]
MKNAQKSITSLSRGERGSVLILVAFCLFALLGFAALAIDGSYLSVVRNELQNAADAGALAGARILYDEYGTAVNADANQRAYDSARDNKAIAKIAGAIPVDVNFGQNLDVQRGHWSFATSSFTPNDSLAAVDLWNVSTDELDANANFINAVRVVARRQASPAASFFARIFGYQDFEMSAEAIAYIGFAGTLAPGEVDQPIAICQQSITAGEIYNCSLGRMLNSGSNTADHNTAGWTNFSQPCETASASSMQSLFANCMAGNPEPIQLGGGMGTTGGVETPSLTGLMGCWKSALFDSDGDGVENASIDTDGDGIPDMPWNLTLPVIDCDGNNVSPCSRVVGAVNVNIVWILEKENDIDSDAPYKMGNWSNSDPSGAVRWDEFVSTFNLRTVDDLLATVANGGFKKKSIYFLPDCTPHELKGKTGGENFGVLARIPVIVK